MFIRVTCGVTKEMTGEIIKSLNVACQKYVRCEGSCADHETAVLMCEVETYRATEKD